MKYYFYRFLIIVIGLCFVGCGISVNQPEQVLKAPEFIYTDIDGEQFILDHLFDSQVSPEVEEVLLVFWSMHCSKSRKFIAELRDRHVEKHPELKVLLVNLNAYEALDDLKLFIHENRLDKMNHAFSGNREQDETYLAFKSPAFPVGYLINKNREITKIYE